jgi:mRNA-degrading endonuclease HigB of HigAB toxin-antitoxin module
VDDDDNDNNNNNKYKSPKHRIGPCPEAKIAVETYTQPVNLKANFSKCDVPSYYSRGKTVFNNISTTDLRLLLTMTLCK